MQIRRLNTLRGIAALIVLVGHYSNKAQLWDAVLGSRGPQLGVMLFFLLSAFLMTVLYMDRQPTAQAMRGFGVARAARILPLYVLIVVLSWLAQQTALPWLTKTAYDIFTIKSLVSHLLTLYGSDELWTVPTELHFYLIFAALWWLRPRVPWVLPVFCIAVLATFASGHWPLVPTGPVHGFPIELKVVRGLPFFTVGMIIGLAYNRWRPAERVRHHAWVIALPMILLLYPVILEWLTGWTYAMWFTPAILVAMAAIFSILVFLVPDGNPILENRVGDHLGKVSYSLYLLHFPILLLFKQAGLAKGADGLALYLAATVLAASATYRFYEFPTRRWLRALAPQPDADIAVAAPTRGSQP
jgi:peptidoglycan/LPS O-acetylase OafA/YrhL